MSDFPGIVNVLPNMALNTWGEESPLADCSIVTSGAGAWPAANRALYCPVIVQIAPITVYKMSFIVGVTAGNYDIGIYDQLGTRLVSVGSTAVPAAGLALVDIADTTLANPGLYYLAMVCSTVTTLTIQRMAPNDIMLRAQGMYTEALGSTVLPATWTAVTTNATSYVPFIQASLTSVV